MSYTLHNGTPRTIIVPPFEGEDAFTVEPGGKHSTENHRLALSAVDYGLALDRDEAVAAIDAERERTRAERAGEASAEKGPDVGVVPVPTPANTVVEGVGDQPTEPDPSVAAQGKPAATPAPEDPADAVGDLKGQELDDALESLGLSKSGTVAEKRSRLAEKLSA